jgi:cell shape-determining protein MreC
MRDKITEQHPKTVMVQLTDALKDSMTKIESLQNTITELRDENKRLQEALKTKDGAA